MESLGSSRDREEERGGGGVRVAKRDAVIRRYWQFSRSITGTRKEKILRLKFIEGVERAGQGRGKEKKMARDAGDRERNRWRERERGRGKGREGR